MPPLLLDNRVGATCCPAIFTLSQPHPKSHNWPPYSPQNVSLAVNMEGKPVLLKHLIGKKTLHTYIIK